MKRHLAAILGSALVVVASAAPAEAQTCSGATSCALTANNTFVTIPAIVSLATSANNANAGTSIPGNATELTAPSDLVPFGGFIQTAGPSFTIRSNRAWRLQVRANATTFTYTGPETITSPRTVGTLSFANNPGFTGPLAMTDAFQTVANGARSNTGTVSVFYRLSFSADLGADENAAGTHAVGLVFQLIAP